MATLANLIKNIDPPRQMTWAEYNALPTQIKNDGTQYYITDRDDAIQTAATTPALDKDGNNSDVQTELDSLNSTIKNIYSGDQEVYTAQFLKAPNSSGIHTDEWGGFIHNRRDAQTDYWNIKNNDGTVVPIKYYFETGEIQTAPNRVLAYGGKNSSQIITPSQIICPGTVHNSSKSISFFVPICLSVANITLNKIEIGLRHIDGGYCYMKYGTNGSSTIVLDWNKCTIWENSVQKYTNSINSISSTIRNCGGFNVVITFNYPLTTTSAGTTNIKNWSSVSCLAYITATLS